MQAGPPTPEKNLRNDLQAIEDLPVKTKELSVLMDQSEKATGKRRVALTKVIVSKSAQK